MSTEPAVSHAQPHATVLRQVFAFALGLCIAAALHLAASVLILLALQISGGEAISVFVFWGFIGLTQWPYLLPATLVCRRLGFRTVTRGLWAAGAAGVLLTTALLAADAAPALYERLGGETPANQVHSVSEATVSAVSGGTLSVLFSNGETQAMSWDSTTRFGYLGPGWKMQAQPAGPAVLRPGSRVGVDWVLRQHRPRLVSVHIWVERPPTP